MASNIIKITKAKKKPKNHLGFLGLLLVATIICFFLLSPIFSISDVEVSGNNVVSSDYIISASGILYGENILRLNKFSMIDRINAIPAIEETTIKRKWPDTLLISVKEKEVIAEVEFYGSKLFISESGDVVSVVTDEFESDFPVLEGITVCDVVAGEGVVCQEQEKFKKYLEVLKKLKENDMLNEILKLRDDDGILVYFKIGHVAFLGGNDNLQKKMEWLKVIWSKEVNPSYIDLHNLDRVITKPVWGIFNGEKNSSGEAS